MKPRHAAALALVGWYLIVPPPMPNKIADFFYGKYIPTGFDTRAPLSNWWRVDSAYENQSTCLHSRSVHINEWKTLSKTRPSPTHDKELEQMLDSVCVDEHDPRFRRN